MTPFRKALVLWAVTTLTMFAALFAAYMLGWIE